MLVQLVRGALGREPRSVDLSRINVSSCGFVVTLHGVVAHPDDRITIEGVVGKVPGVLGVESKLGAGSVSR
ncbi:MAG: BON domain-containing protein [Rubrobacteraceae bacterium]